MKKIITVLLILSIIVALPVTAQATPQITIVMNGSLDKYAPGAVMVVYGKITENNRALAAVDAFIEVKNLSEGGTSIFYSQAKTDDSGYFKTGFNLPDNSELAGDYIQVSVKALEQEQHLTVTVQQKAVGVNLVGFNPKGYLNGQQIQEISADTDKLVLVFDHNINYFYNSTAPGDLQYLGKNEKNEDCIRLFTGDQQLPCTVSLLDTGGENKLSYISLQNGTTLQAQQRQMIFITPNNKLEPGKIYRIVVNGEISANNSATMGSEKQIFFKTAAAAEEEPGTIPPAGSGGLGGGMILPIASEIITGDDIGDITTHDGIGLLSVNPLRVIDAIKGTDSSAIAIDISILKGVEEKAVKLPAEVVDAIKKANKSVILQDGNLAVIIPPAAIVQGKDITISYKKITNQVLPKTSDQVSCKEAYEFTAKVGEQQIHNFQQQLTITLPVPEGVIDEEKLGTYYLNEATKQWEYVGGRIVDGKLVFTTNHFSKYMVGESQKTFKDISTHWARRAIEILAARNIVSGVSSDNFAPQKSITRADFTAMLSKIVKLNSTSEKNQFKDIKGTEGYAGYVNNAAKAGIAGGYNGYFRPKENITRQEMAAMVMRAYYYAGGSSVNQKEIAFTDKGKISSWALKSVKEVYSLGLMKGNKDGSFGANSFITRAESVAVLKLLMDKLQLY